jgi:hypothetical protein
MRNRFLIPITGMRKESQNGSYDSADLIERPVEAEGTSAHSLLN